MELNALLIWQWQGYHRYHRSMVNIAIHLIAVPLFIVAFLFLIVSLVFFNLPTLLWSISALMLAMLLQAIGHQKEHLAPEKFTGVSNFIVRLLLEQFVTFPKFVCVSGIAYLKRGR